MHQCSSDLLKTCMFDRSLDPVRHQINKAQNKPKKCQDRAGIRPLDPVMLAHPRPLDDLIWISSDPILMCSLLSMFALPVYGHVGT